MKRVLIGLIVGLALWPIGVACYLFFGNPPVAVADNPFPLEQQILKTVRHRRISSQAPKSAPIQVNDENLMAGAQTYTANCASCHGMYNSTTTFSQHMYPWPPPMWQAHGSRRVIGVSDDPVGHTYWKVANGIRLTGMPAFKQVLTPTQIWQVSLLLANAGKPLPPQVKDVLSQAIPNLPSQSATPGIPSQPAMPIQPSAPIQSGQPAGSTPPSISGQPTTPAQPAGSGQPSGNAQPSGQNNPGHP